MSATLSRARPPALFVSGFRLLQVLLDQFNRRKILTLATLALTTLSACSPEENPTGNLSNPDTQATPVRVATVQMRNNDEILRFAGISRVRQRAVLTFQVSGVIQSRNVEIGQQVKTGQVLMTLYSPSLQPAYDAASHRLTQLQTDQLQASKEAERLKTLYESGVIPLQELEQQNSRVSSLMSAVNNAQATLEQAANLLRETELIAPFDASIEQLLVEPGEFAQQGQPVIRVASSTQLEIEIQVPAHLAETLSIGQQVPVWNSLSATDSDQGQLTASIIEIGQSSTGQNALYPVVIALADNSVRTGEALEIGIPRNLQPALVIPMSAVMRSADGLTVFLVNNNNRVQRVTVEIEQLQGEYAVIKPGSLTQGMQIVYAGITRLANGDRIEVLP